MTDNSSTAVPDIYEDSTGSSVSVYVPGAIPDPDPNAAPNSTIPTYSYLRLGNIDTGHENGLPPDPTSPKTAGNGSSNEFLAGTLLYTTGENQIYAPSTVITSPSVTINTLDPAHQFPSLSVGNGLNVFSPSSLSATLSPDKTKLYSASLTTIGEDASMFHARPANVTFQNIDQLTMLAGDSSTFLNGNSLTCWNGNDQSIGVGGLLWANLGITSNLFGGWIINVTNTNVGYQGFGGFDITTDGGSTAINSIRFGVNPATTTFIVLSQRITQMANIAMGLATVAAGVYSGEVLGTTKLDTSVDVGSLTNKMTTTNKDIEILTEIVIGIQALSVLVAAALLIAKKLIPVASTSDLFLGNGVSSLKSGLSRITVGAGITLDATAGFVEAIAQQAAVQAPAGISFVCGASRIDMTPGSIALAVGTNGILITAAAITTSTAVNAAGLVPPPPPTPTAMAVDAAAQAQILAIDLLMA